MKLKLCMLALTATLGLAATASQANIISKDDYKREQDRIAMDFKSSRAGCDSKAGNAKDICVSEATGRQKAAQADLDARDKGTAEAREAADVAKADGELDTAKQRCQEYAGNSRDVCVKDAQAANVKAKADAKLSAQTAAISYTAAKKTMAAENRADKEKRQADYQAARERCDSLAGSAKDACVNKAKGDFGM